MISMKHTFSAIIATFFCLLSFAQPKPVVPVEPLLHTIRVQSAPYNNSCPYYNYGDSVSSERCLVGCVATAIEQLLSYYRYPYCLQDSIAGWTTPNYSLESIPSGSVIDWDDVADLSLWCGMMVRMKYTPDASAASMWNAEEPLRRVFGYKTVKMLDRSLYSFDSWHRILQNELLCGRPVAYVGYNNFMNGHAFNIDGVNKDGLYHCNWGENERMNGYYSLEHLCELQPHYDATDWGRMAGFHANQYMLVLHPDSVDDYLELDTVENFAQAVKVEDISFHRDITSREYVLTDVTLTNLSFDTLYHSYLLLLNLPKDTALVEQAKTATISSVKLLPGETRTQTISCHYSAPVGEALVGITFDGSTISYQERVDIKPGVIDNIVITDYKCNTSPDGTAVIQITMKNEAPSGVSGRLLYYRLYPENSSLSCSMDYRVLNLSAGEEYVDTFYFHHLSPEKEYTLHIGGWSTSICSITFKIPEQSTGINDIYLHEIEKLSHPLYYDLHGRKIAKPERGIYIVDGKKVFYDGRGNYQ